MEDGPRNDAALHFQIWKTAVDTQMHFNEMSVKSRQLGLTFVAAALGVGVVLLSNERDFSFVLTVLEVQCRIHVSVILVIAAALAMQAVRILDFNVYHKMLRGAVSFGEDFEEQYLKVSFPKCEKGLTQAISHFSRHSDAAIQTREDVGYAYMGKNCKSAEIKIRRFYAFVTTLLMVASVLLFLLSADFQLQSFEPAPAADRSM